MSRIKLYDAIEEPKDRDDEPSELIDAIDHPLGKATTLKDLWRQDIEESVDDLRAELEELRAEINSIRKEIKSDLGELRAELKGDLGEMQAEIESDLDRLGDQLKDRTAVLRHELSMMSWMTTGLVVLAVALFIRVFFM